MILKQRYHLERLWNQKELLERLAFLNPIEVLELVVLGHVMMLHGVLELLLLRVVSGLMFQRTRKWLRVQHPNQ
jgi:hypothetical protein